MPSKEILLQDIVAVCLQGVLKKQQFVFKVTVVNIMMKISENFLKKGLDNFAIL